MFKYHIKTLSAFFVHSFNCIKEEWAQRNHLFLELLVKETPNKDTLGNICTQSDQDIVTVSIIIIMATRRGGLYSNKN